MNKQRSIWRCGQLELTPNGVGDNEQCTTRTVKVRNGRAIVDEALTMYVFLRQCKSHLLIVSFRDLSDHCLKTFYFCIRSRNVSSVIVLFYCNWSSSGLVFS